MFDTHLFTVVSNGLQNGTQRLEAHSHVNKMSSKEEIVDVTQA